MSRFSVNGFHWVDPLVLEPPDHRAINCIEVTLTVAVNTPEQLHALRDMANGKGEVFLVGGEAGGAS